MFHGLIGLVVRFSFVGVRKGFIFGDSLAGFSLLEIDNLRLIGLNPPTELSPPR